jgi:tetratricopeptide (TPR) repeat protein
VGDGELVQEWLARLTTVVAETRAEADRVAEVMDRDADELAALRSLGYTAGPRDAVADSLIDELSVAGLDPKDFIDVAMAGRDLEMGWPDRAEFKLARFLAGAPDSVVRPEARPLVSTAHQNLALLAMRRGEYDVAAEHYRDAVEFSPANEAAREGRIRALNLGGRGNEALREVDAYLLATPADERLHLHRAFSLLLLGRPAEARAEAERIAAAGKRPDVVPVAEMLAEQLREAGTPDVLALYLTPR